MEAKAISRYIKQSPRKIRKTLNSVRGKKVGVALNMLHFSQEKAAVVIEKTIHSAVANLMSIEDKSNIIPEDLEIKEAYVDGGPRAKRFRAASMGRASLIRKESAHLTVVVTDEKI